MRRRHVAVVDIDMAFGVRDPQAVVPGYRESWPYVWDPKYQTK